SYEFLKQKIFCETSDNQANIQETIYTNNLLNAKNYFSEQLKSMDFEQIESLYTKVTQNILFNIYSMSEEIDVHVSFETMNNRGKPLSHLELLKNRL
ncbi:GmrSD restriction endonuclease domain-containing protein, partial [Staphylococcus aureus]|uniref:GmrSD restriction endonuclease domain-containing protein n=1 Tax=Staphylococcus aureus TaxID=1280 RepID=UPI00301DC44E